MLDPIILATTGLTGYFIQSVGSGVVGNEAHRFYRHVLSRLGNDQAERVNHDIARAVRLAQIDALERVLAGYAAWAPGGPDQPTDFLAAATTFCRTQRGRVRTDPASLALPSAEPLEATIDGLLAHSPAGSLAGQRDQALAAFAEDAVLAELRDGPPAIAVPDDFAAYLSKGAGPGHPRFLDEFADEVREAVKSNPRFRDIFLLSGIAELKAQGFETAEAIARIETRFGIDRREFRAALDRIEDSNRQIAKGQTAQIEMLVGIDERMKRVERIMAGWDANPAAREAEKNGLDRSTIVSLAQRLRPDEMLDFDQAMRELERAVAIACDIIARGQRGTNHDEFVNAVLARVAADNQAGKLDAGARAIDDGLAELDAAHRRSKVTLLEVAVQQHTLRRDAAAVARRIETLVAVGQEAARPAWHPAFRERYDSLYADGETKGVNFPLAVAIFMAQRMVAAATDSDERGTAGNLLGIALLTLGARESGTARLEEAVAAYRAALEEWTRERVPLDWATTQNNLGTALATLGARESGTARLEEAVAAYRAVLEEWTRDRVPLDWAGTQNNLGNALQTLGARESGTARLEESVAAYRAALEERTRERVPLDWATTQNNLGTALRTLGARESGTARLAEAVAAYRAALEERTRERVPLNWAMTQNNLGNALRTLGERESGTARLEEAVAVYRAALEEWTRERVPLDWAMTQNNLGTALATLGARESGTARLEEAVAAYRAVLEEWTRDRVPLDWAGTQNNLGNALQTLGARESGTARLEESVAAYRAALEERTRERVPLDWATTQNNLGTALRTLGARESGTARLAEAVAAYRAALEERTRERVPLNWAMTQNNLGNALRTLGERESGTARLEEAVAVYRAALEEWTRERVPLDWAMTQNNLGNALWTLGARESGTARLEEAVAAWDQCLTVVATEWPPEWVESIRANRKSALDEIARRSTPPA